MGLNKKSVDDINVKGLRVLCRCDFNVPLKDGKITDENRLVAALPTIKKLIADGGKVILCSHLGKVKTEEDYTTKTLAPVAARLSELLGQEVKFAADREVVGPNARAAVEAMKAVANESFGYNEDAIVSSDIVGMRFGSLFDSTQTMVNKVADDLYEVQVVSWYDNENSYTSQMVRTIKYFSELA